MSKYVLVGGGLTSLAAIRAIRQKDTAGSITLIGAEQHLPYDRPSLSKEFLRGQKQQYDVLFEQEAFYKEKQVDGLLGKTATGLDTKARKVTLSDGSTILYDRLLLATGGRPRALKVEGSNLKGVHYLRTLDDSKAIQADGMEGKRAVIIGAGFIGMEVAASLTQRGVSVTVLETLPHIWGKFLDEGAASYFQRYCSAKGVTFRTRDSVKAFAGKDRLQKVLTTSGQELPCDLACVAVGIDLNLELAQKAGIKIDNGIVANERLEASAPGVYAGGDIVNFYDPIFQKRRRIEHWGHADYTDGLAGQNMLGENKPYDLVSYVWSDIFDLHLEFAGDETEHDERIIRGRMEDNSFAVLYLKKKALTAYFAINWNDKEYGPLQELIKSRKSLAGKEKALQDKATDVTKL